MRADTPRIFKAVYSNVIRQNHNWLVVFRHPSEKYELVNGKDDIPCMKWKIKHVPKSQSYNQWISMVDTEHPTWSIDDWGFPHENSPLIQPTRIMIMSGLHMFTGKICLGINHSKIPRAKKI
jgi:hypothetical protein